MTTKITKPGIYDITMSEYLADPCPGPSLSRSLIHTLLTSTPTHAYRDHPRLGARNYGSSRRADFGSAAHSLVLGRGQDVHEIQALNPRGDQATDYRTKAAQAERDAAIEADQIPILAKDRAEIDGMVAVAREFMDHLKISGRAEQTIVWEEDGVWFRCRPDLLDDFIQRCIDYKTATSAHPLTWCKKTIFPGGYDLSAALTIRGLKAVTGEDWPYLFLAQEMVEPWAPALITAGPNMVAHANEKIDCAVSIWKRCRDADEWPRYGYGVYVADVPAYERYDWEERVTMMGGGDAE